MAYADAVHFDFDGSLALAFELYRLGGEINDLRDARSGKADTALDGWLGAFADDFLTRKGTEFQSSTEVASLLQSEANAWATQWKYAMDQENNNRWARECDRVRDNRSMASRFVGHFAGHDDLPNRPREAMMPAAPYFTATRTFASY